MGIYPRCNRLLRALQLAISKPKTPAAKCRVNAHSPSRFAATRPVVAIASSRALLASSRPGSRAPAASPPPRPRARRPAHPTAATSQKTSAEMAVSEDKIDALIMRLHEIEVGSEHGIRTRRHRCLIIVCLYLHTLAASSAVA